jgi:spoIIIJ-associated protein
LELDNPQVAALFHEYKEMFFGAFALNPSSVQTVMSDHEVKVLVQDAHFEDFLSKSDRLSLAFEHIFKRIAQKKLGDIYVRMVLDAGRSSEKREERLVGIARVLAEKVRKTGKSAVLSSKSSQERRVIHLALDGFAGVVTRSVGTGEKRRLVIAASHKKSIGVEKAAYRRYKKKPCSKSGNEKKWLQNEE